MNSTVLVLPGWHDSGPLHWQSLWEKQDPAFVRVQQMDWETPKRLDWVNNITAAVDRAQAPVAFVAHSLGCIAVAHWVRTAPKLAYRVKAALLVAPADVDREDVPWQVKDFSPIPRQALPFSSVVVASSNDPYLTMASAHELVSSWGSGLAEVGEAGHINSESGLGDWPEGRKLFRRVMEDS
jgi:predicted alpha/beta hydrolase family esterase